MRRRLAVLAALAACGHTSSAFDPGGAVVGEPAPSPSPAHDAASTPEGPAGGCPPDAQAAAMRAQGLDPPVDDGVIEVRLRLYVRADGRIDCATLFSTEDPSLDAACFDLLGPSWRPLHDAAGQPTAGWVTYLCQFTPRDAERAPGADADSG